MAELTALGALARLVDMWDRDTELRRRIMAESDQMWCLAILEARIVLDSADEPSEADHG